MGPIALFDKSFLQSIGVDESVWFDHFFMPMVCPIFYVETLGNLAKETTGRSPEAIVREIANKFPEWGGSPCAFHANLAISNLLGHHIGLDIGCTNGSQRIQQIAGRAREPVQPGHDHRITVIQLGQQPRQLLAVRRGKAALVERGNRSLI